MKQRKNKSSSHNWVYWIWGVNAAVLICLLLASIFYFNTKRDTTVNALAETPRAVYVQPTQKIPPTSYFLPTLTPNPYSTLPVFETSTPFILENGQGGRAIGFSMGLRPIEVYTFGTGQKEYLIVAGIHGGSEWNTIALANELIKYIYDHIEIIPNDVTLHIIRNMNPDGEARSHNVDGRVNNNGVDLNRNFPTQNWVADWDRDGCWVWRETTGGAFGGSEPETRTVMSFILGRKIQAMISYHSAALGVFPGGVPWEEDSMRLGAKLGQATGYPYPPVDTGCVYTGTLADWAVENGVGAAVDMELTDHSHTDFDKNLKALKALISFVP